MKENNEQPKQIRCPKCRGRGRIQAPDGRKREIECPRCGGFGLTMGWPPPGPLDVDQIAGTWPGDVDDGFEEAIDDMRHGHKDKDRLDWLEESNELHISIREHDFPGLQVWVRRRVRDPRTRQWTGDAMGTGASLREAIDKAMGGGK